MITEMNFGSGWHHRGGIHVKGQLFDDHENYWQGELLLDYFASATDRESFQETVRAGNGSFAVIVETCGDEILAAVDRVRSLPLFYTQRNGDISIADNVYALLHDCNNGIIDPIAREELLQVGYTVGPTTLHPEIKQIEAGELISYKTSNGFLDSKCYFTHAHDNYVTKSVPELINELDELTTQWARRLITSAQGRTIVIGLSGGYDSRSIACALKREQYDNVICFSYGSNTSWEHTVASRVASVLRYPIHIIEYNRDRWKSAINSQGFTEFCNVAFQHCAIPCIQEYPAVEALTQASLIPKDSIFVPGYCGDLQGGSYVPQNISANHSRKLLAQGVDHYLYQNLFGWLSKAANPNIKQAILERIHLYTSQFPSDNIEDFCSLLEDWFTRNTVAKFVINTVRTYEHFSYEWRLPLWDNDLIEWWYHIPLEHRVNSSLFHEYLFERLFSPLDVGFKKPQPKQSRSLIKQYLPPTIVPFLAGIKNKVLARTPAANPDINSFDDAAEMLLEKLSPTWNAGDFKLINSVVGAWCLEQHDAALQQ